ncbi:MAG: hypothetical protein HY422_02900 [Candidatus Komeilibacteria bacterium]|nr:hypothetical protein [Candidatus Komeilibacteria bacterium]
MPAIDKQLAREAHVVAYQFRRLSRLVPRLLTAVVASQEKATPATKDKRRSPRLSPSVRRALKLQGQYMGGMRGMSVRGRARIKKIRRQRGIRAAIAAIKRAR